MDYICTLLVYLIEILQKKYYHPELRKSHIAICKWAQKYKPERIFTKRKRILEFIINETQLKVGSKYSWIWIAIESSLR
jgi:transposase-like protein